MIICDLYNKNNGWKHRPIDRANVMSYDSKGKKYKEIIISNI